MKVKKSSNILFIAGIILSLFLSACGNLTDFAAPGTEEYGAYFQYGSATPGDVESGRVFLSSKPTAQKTDSTDFKSDLKVHFIDVGQADSILVELPNSQIMLIDGGNKVDGPSVLKYLKSLKIKTIDYLVATHPHEDHIGGLSAIIKELEIKSIYMPDVTANTEIFGELLDAIEDKGLKINIAKAGAGILSIPDLKISIVAPVKTEYANLNDYSAVIKLTYKKTSFLFAGDAEAESEGQITADIKADVLKVGHHGSSAATSESFLKKVNPSAAVISVGKDNSYGHPSKVTLERLNRAGVKVYRTDKAGTIIATSNGKDISIDKSPSAYESDNSNNNNKNTSVTVYITKTGTKYHRDGCKYLSKSKIAISLEQAKKSYGPCSVCKPPT